MRVATAAVAVLAAAALTFSPAQAGFDGEVNFFLGQKSLDDFWSPSLDTQTEFGAVMSFGQDDWPVHIAADVLTSARGTAAYDPSVGSSTTNGLTFEIDAGVRKIWKAGQVRPYIGGGVGVIGAALMFNFGFDSVAAIDAALGIWADTGVFFRLGSHFNIGLDLRYSSAKVDLDLGSGIGARDVNAGGFSYVLLMGFGW